MSRSDSVPGDATEDYGPAQGRVTPPIDALATVTLDGSPITTLTVPASTTLRIHVADRTSGNMIDDYHDLDDVPEPALAENVPEDAQAEAVVPRSAWVTVMVGDERRARVAAARDTLARVHLEPDDRGDK